MEVSPAPLETFDHAGNTNLYWWTLTYFVFQNEKHRAAAVTLAQRGGDIKTFEQLSGPVDTVQAEWLDCVRRIKAGLAGKDVRFFKATEVPARSELP